MVFKQINRLFVALCLLDLLGLLVSATGSYAAQNSGLDTQPDPI